MIHVPDRLPARIRRMSFRRRKVAARSWVEAHVQAAVDYGRIVGGKVTRMALSRDNDVHVDYEYTPVRPLGHVVIHNHVAPSMGYEVDAKFFDAQLGQPWGHRRRAIEAEVRS